MGLFYIEFSPRLCCKIPAAPVAKGSWIGIQGRSAQSSRASSASRTFTQYSPAVNAAGFGGEQ
jgi:hypothetical protein